MDAFEEQTDPAADFLAREQAELGEELGEELGILNAAPPVIEEPLVIPHMEGLSLEDQQELEAVNQEVSVERTTTPSPAFIMPPRYHQINVIFQAFLLNFPLFFFPGGSPVSIK